MSSQQTEEPEDPGVKQTTMRWYPKDLAVIEQAANAYGITTQAYIRYAAIKMAVKDISRYKRALPD